MYNQNEWNNNKCEILFPFAESGEEYTFQFWSNGKLILEEKIEANGGIGYPMTDFFNEMTLDPVYDKAEDKFGVKVTTEATNNSSFFTEETNELFKSKEIGAQYFLGYSYEENEKTYYKSYGISASEIGLEPDVTYWHQISFDTPDYEEYNNSFFACPYFSIETDSVGYLAYIWDEGKIKFGTIEAPKKSLYLEAVNNGVNITINKQEDWEDSKEFILKDRISNISTHFTVNWGNKDKVKIFYPFVQYWKTELALYDKDDNLISNIAKTWTNNGIGYPYYQYYNKIDVIPSYTNNKCSVKINTTNISLKDFIAQGVNYNIETIDIKPIAIKVYAGDKYNDNNNINRTLLGTYYFENNEKYNELNATYNVPVSDSVNLEDYNNEYFVELVFGFNILTEDLGKVYIEAPWRSEKKRILNAQAKNISLTAESDGIHVTITKKEGVDNYYIQNIETGIGFNTNQIPWTNDKKEIVYPFSTSGELCSFDLYLNGSYNERQSVGITATGGMGYPVTEEFNKIKLTPSYNKSTDKFSVTVATDAQSIDDFFIDALKDTDYNLDIDVQFYLGIPNSGNSYGFSSVTLQDQQGNLKIGTITHDYNGELPAYSQYNNKFSVQPCFSLYINLCNEPDNYYGISFWGYSSYYETGDIK